MFKKTEFSIIYEKSKKEWKDNLKLIIVLALIVGILSTTISLFSLFDFKSQGIDIFNPVVDLKNPVPITPTNSNYILYFSYLIQFITAMISMVSLIYFFKNAINKKISFSESFNYF